MRFRSIAFSAVILALLAGAVAALFRGSVISFNWVRATASGAPAVVLDYSPPAHLSFNEDIQPILSDNCYFCHGQDTTARKANLRVDREEFAFLPRPNGQPVIVKGHPESSALIQRISSADPNQVMPPPSSHKQPLTPEQIAILRQWVKDGAQYEEHWAFVKPVRASPPAVKKADWVKNPIDNFVLAKLEAHDLAPEPEADRRSLIRRVTFDLTGLPPTPQEVETFLADTSTNAYEKVVDRLLGTPQYGENEARYWLDCARYADTRGLQNDMGRSIYPYRDWVINAFTNNMRFDEFVIEQEAGDLLPNRTIQQQVATGFTRCGLSTGEVGVISDEVLAMYAKEAVETTAATYLGLTMGCCACHDHKFDPISQKEFYEFSAFFRNTTQTAISPDLEVSVPPYVRVPPIADTVRWAALPGEMADTQKALDAERVTFAARFKGAAEIIQYAQNQVKASTPVSADGMELSLPVCEGTGRQIISVAYVTYNLSGDPKWTNDGLLGPVAKLEGGTYAELGNVGDFDTGDKFSFGCWIRASAKPSGTVAGRMDVNNNYRGWNLIFDNGRPAVQLISAWPFNAIMVSTRKELTVDSWQHIFVTYDGSGKASGLKIYFDGTPQDSVLLNDDLKGTIRTTAQTTLGERAGASFPASGVAIQDLRIYRRVLTPDEIKTLAGAGTIQELLKTPGDKINPIQRQFVSNYCAIKSDPGYTALRDKASRLKSEYNAIVARSAVTMVMDEKPTAPFAYLLKRGQYDQKGEKLSPGVPKVMPPMPAGVPNNRLGLAKWLVAPENPLLSRVTVNRFWQQIFGTGIVRTSEDFGIMGERPVNQPLLDWLAVEFRESGWDVKHMFKLMVMSAAYRQSAVVTAEKLEKDPENRLISRGPRYRLDAEEIRDQALAASGLLNSQIGGPSVKPYQPPGLWEAVAALEENQHYVPDKGAALYRRTMYTYMKRLAPQPQLTIFDGPSREVCTVRRDRTDSPLQALAMENDPQYMEAARHLAVNAIQSASDPVQRLGYISERLLARPLAKDEQDVLLANLANFKKGYSTQPDAAQKVIRIGDSAPNTTIPAPEQAAWTMVASEFLNLDETLNK